MILPVVCIVGRPNVGKSTLFNRIVGEKLALVQDFAGVTRDRHYAATDWGGRSFHLVDTGGFDPQERSGVMAAVRNQCLAAISEADVIVYLMDARQGLLPDDQEIIQLLRQSQKPILWTAGKIDTPDQINGSHELYEFGAEQIFPVSPLHGLGVGDLLDAVIALLPRNENEKQAVSDTETRNGLPVVRLALIGRPNAGKSSLFNRLVGQNRAVVHSTPGTTRDPVDVPFESQGYPFILVDTAGMRRKARIHQAMEHISVLQSIRAIEHAHVACLVCDAAVGIAEQEARLASLVQQRGKTLLIAINKWDLVKNDTEKKKKLADELRRRLRFVAHCPVLRVSALTGNTTSKIGPAALSLFKEAHKRIPTSDLNRWLAEMVDRRSPPSAGRRPIRFYYVTQPMVAPPTFVFSTNHPKSVGASYKRFLANRLRECFGFTGTPLKLKFKQHRKKRK
jgi:GTP-binding protein